MPRLLYTFLAFILILVLCISAQAQDSEEYQVSPNEPWGDISEIEDQDGSDDDSMLESILLYIPNRILDFVDIFRADLGVGPAVGGVVRVTEYGQAGIRTMAPLSARVGLFGRDYPFLLESSNELGISPAFIKSKDRKVCSGEVGAGLDLLLIGAYLGICADEVFDFLGGIFLIDFKEDDL